MIREFIKKIGTGPHGSRDLDREEASRAAALILSGAATPAQTGALLLGLRLKGETGPEMAGFLDALRQALPRISSGVCSPPPDLDIGDPYDGRVRTTSLVVAAALLAGQTGMTAVLHGLSGVPVKRGPGVLESWRAHGLALSTYAEARHTLDRHTPVCLDQSAFLPSLARLLPLRQELGLRTLFNTVEKAVNPLEARARIVGIFHAPVMEKLGTAFGGIDDGSGRVLFVCGPEGGVDLHAHRATMAYLTDPAAGLILSPVMIPAPPPGTPGLPAPPSGAPRLQEILADPEHPLSLHLRRQTALFLFASGKFPDFEAAFASLDGTVPAGAGSPGKAVDHA